MSLKEFSTTPHRPVGKNISLVVKSAKCIKAFNVTKNIYATYYDIQTYITK